MKLHYSMHLNQTGYSIAAQDYILSIKHVRPDVDIQCRFFNKTHLGVSRNRLQLFKKGDQQRGRVNIYHSVPHRYKQTKESLKNIGMCLFETICLPPEWADMMNKMDCIVTASAFNKGVFENNGVKVPVHVVPHAFDSKLFHGEIKTVGRYGKITFMSMGTWKNRKNWDTLIQGFYQAFESKDNVCLLVKTDKPEFLKQTVERIKRTSKWRSKNTAPVYSEDRKIVTFEDIPQIMKKADVYVSCSLGEGFGLPGLHAMALGIPVITTRFGGSLEYALENNCTYIRPKKYTRYNVMDNIPQFQNAIWPVITAEEVSNRMREVYENYPTEKAKRAYEFVHNNFDYDTIGKKFCEVIEDGLQD